MASANRPCGAVIVYFKFFIVMWCGKKMCTLAPQFLGWRAEGNCLCLEKFLNKILMVWVQVHRNWIPFNFRVSAEECSTFMEKRRIEKTRGENREERKEELARTWGSTLTNTMKLECPKDSVKTEINSVPFCQLLLLLYKSLLQIPLP